MLDFGYVPGKYRTLVPGAMIELDGKQAIITEMPKNSGGGNGGVWYVLTTMGKISANKVVKDWKITPPEDVPASKAADLIDAAPPAPKLTMDDVEVKPVTDVSSETPEQKATREKDEVTVEGLRQSLKAEGDANIAKWEKDPSPGVNALAVRAQMLRDMNEKPVCGKCGKDLNGETHRRMSDGTRLCHSCQ